MKIKNFLKKIVRKIGFTQHFLFSSKKVSAGFTLVETLVAITILLTTIVGPMEIASKALFSAFYARDQITAYYLAQEGIEYVRNSRDNYYLDPINAGGTNWPAPFSSCLYDVNHYGCKVDFYSGIVQNTTPALASTTLNYNSSSGTYSYQNTPNDKPSKYTRIVTISPDPITNPDYLLVTSTVYWSGSYISGGTKSFAVKETLYRWQTK